MIGFGGPPSVSWGLPDVGGRTLLRDVDPARWSDAADYAMPIPLSDRVGVARASGDCAARCAGRRLRSVRGGCRPGRRAARRVLSAARAIRGGRAARPAHRDLPLDPARAQATRMERAVPILSPAELASALALVGAVILIAALLSGLVERSGVPQVAIFLALGAALGPAGLAALAVELESPCAPDRRDALARADPVHRRALARPARGARAPRARAARDRPGHAAARRRRSRPPPGCCWVFRLPAAAVLGAALASTDPVLLKGLLRRPELPAAARQALRMESGLNDVVLLPIVLVSLAFLDDGRAERRGLGAARSRPPAARAGSRRAGRAVRPRDARSGAAPDRRAARLRIALLARHRVRRLRRRGIGARQRLPRRVRRGRDDRIPRRRALRLLPRIRRDDRRARAAAHVRAARQLADLERRRPPRPDPTLLYRRARACSRVPSIYLAALAPTRIDWPTRWWMAWFGPRGLSSLLLVLLAVFAGMPEGGEIFRVACLVVLLSILLHGGHADLDRAARSGRERARADRGCDEVPDAARDG